MARVKGRQVFLRAEEIERLAAIVEQEISRTTNQIDEGIIDLHWAIDARRRQGPKPERADFSPLLPNPEEDYRYKLIDWTHTYAMPLQIVAYIREDRKQRAELRRLLGKLYYYG